MAFLRVSVSSLMADGPHFTYFPTPISFLETALSLARITGTVDTSYMIPIVRTPGTILFRPRKSRWRLKAMKPLNFFSNN